MSSGATVSPPSEGRSWLHRWWWLWLGLAWVLVGLLFAGQTVWLGGFSWRAAIGWAVLDWGLWIPLAPLVVWLAHRVQINAATWRWAVPVHGALAVILAAAIELTSVVAWQQGWMPDPRSGPRGGQEMNPFPPSRSSRDRSGPRARPGRESERGSPDGGPDGGVRPDFDRRGGPGAMRGPMPSEREGPRLRVPMGTGRGRLALPIYFVLVAAAHAVAYHRRSLERERRALLAEARLAEARALALQTQLQPHFFFNALNTVASLIYTRPEQAEETICTLGELMRGVLDAAHRREISLREELAFIDRYLAVQQIRFGDRLRVVREIPENTLACAVPTLLLQPLIENAVVHGVAPLPTPGTVTLRARRAGPHLALEVANTCGEGGAASAETAAGPVEFAPRVGLANTRARLEALYGADFRLTHRRTEDGGVAAEVEIPWKWSEA